MSNPSARPGRHRVVVIGSGFGGLFATQALKRADVDITLVARTTHHLFQPLLYQVATGILSVGDIAPATRMVLRKQKNVEYCSATWSRSTSLQARSTPACSNAKPSPSSIRSSWRRARAVVLRQRPFRRVRTG